MGENEIMGDMRADIARILGILEERQRAQERQCEDRRQMLVSQEKRLVVLEHESWRRKGGFAVVATAGGVTGAVITLCFKLLNFWGVK